MEKRDKGLDIKKYRIKNKDFGYELGEDMESEENDMGRREEKRKMVTERMNLELHPGE